MDGSVTVKYKIDRAPPRRGPTLAKDEPATKAAPPQPKVRTDRTARLLALAHHIERLIEQGVLESFADAAQRFGLSRARVTQVVNLLALSPALQEAILTEKVAIAERNLRRVVRHVGWDEQDRLGTEDPSHLHPRQ